MSIAEIMADLARFSIRSRRRPAVVLPTVGSNARRAGLAAGGDPGVRDGPEVRGVPSLGRGVGSRMDCSRRPDHPGRGQRPCRAVCFPTALYGGPDARRVGLAGGVADIRGGPGVRYDPQGPFIGVVRPPGGTFRFTMANLSTGTARPLWAVL